MLSNRDVRQVIPYGLDTGVFKPRDRRAARAKLFELPAGPAQIVLFPG